MNEFALLPAAPRAVAASVAPAPKRSLFNPWIDFLTLGGGSLVVLATMAAFLPRDEETLFALAGTMFFLAYLVNYPHFAHSYQLFYRGFIQKAFSPASSLRYRYLTAGVVVPVAIVAFFGIAVARSDAAMLGLAVNVMLFTVGWHYAKQGFGVLMVTAAHKGMRFSARERRNLLWNVHVTWVTIWLVANNELAMKQYWGLRYIVFDVPDPLLAGMAGAVLVTTLVVAHGFVSRWRRGEALPVNGLIAYACGVHLWLMVGKIEPFLLTVPPLFHSLQYMAVVWRYKLNVERHREQPNAVPSRARAFLGSFPARVVWFALLAGLMGGAGFSWVPHLLDTSVAYDRAIFGAALFMFMAWTLINIHHYFIDNVIWRRDNTEIREHLFRPSVS